VESSRTGLYPLLIRLNLSPPESQEVENPQIVQITHSLTSKQHQVWKFDLSNMVGPLPRCRLILFGSYFHPYLRLPIEQVNCVKPLFVGPSPSEDNDLLILAIVVHGAIRTRGRSAASGGDILPFFSVGVVRPDVVHVVGI
jgi:hypothetical protein